MRVSIATRKDLIAVYSGDCDVNVVERIRDKELLGKRFYGLMYAIRRAVALTKGVLESLREDEIVAFEVSNNTLVQWIQRECSNKDYEEYFNELLEELNTLPIRYTFVYAKVPTAMKFLVEAEDTQSSVELSGMEEFLNA